MRKEPRGEDGGRETAEDAVFFPRLFPGLLDVPPSYVADAGRPDVSDAEASAVN